MQTDAPPADPLFMRSRGTGVAHDVPRLLDLDGAAQYLSIGARTVLELISAGRLRRVRRPLRGDDQLRKILVDRNDLDRLIDSAKETT